jgi:hypothetical protein
MGGPIPSLLRRLGCGPPSGCYGTEVQGEPSPLGLWVDGLNIVDLQGPCCDPETLPCMEGLGRESTR